MKKLLEKIFGSHPESDYGTSTNNFDCGCKVDVESDGSATLEYCEEHQDKL